MQSWRFGVGGVVGRRGGGILDWSDAATEEGDVGLSLALGYAARAQFILHKIKWII